MKNPKLLTPEQLASVLLDIAGRVLTGDSFEGSLEYSALDERCTEKQFAVTGCYRTGNSEGQGGCRIIEGDNAVHAEGAATPS